MTDTAVAIVPVVADTRRKMMAATGGPQIAPRVLARILEHVQLLRRGIESAIDPTQFDSKISQLLDLVIVIEEWVCDGGGVAIPAPERPARGN